MIMTWFINLFYWSKWSPPMFDKTGTVFQVSFNTRSRKIRMTTPNSRTNMSNYLDLTEENKVDIADFRKFVLGE